jgi:hypothetical protein
MWDCLSEVERYRLRDILFPSYHGVITKSCLEFMKRLQMAGMIDPPSLNFYLSYSKFGNYVEIRKSAIEALLIFGYSDEANLNYLISLIEKDPEFEVRIAVMRELTKMAKNREILLADTLSSFGLISRLFFLLGQVIAIQLSLI